MTNVWKLLRLTTLFEFLPVLLVSLMALFTGLALLGASAWLVASGRPDAAIIHARARHHHRAGLRHRPRRLPLRRALPLAPHGLPHPDRDTHVFLRQGRQGPTASQRPRAPGRVPARPPDGRRRTARLLRPRAAAYRRHRHDHRADHLAARWRHRPLALALPALYLARLVLSCASRQTGEERQRTRDAAYRSALLDAAGGADELICAGCAPALKRLTGPANSLLQVPCSSRAAMPSAMPPRTCSTPPC